MEVSAKEYTVDIGLICGIRKWLVIDIITSLWVSYNFLWWIWIYLVHVASSCLYNCNRLIAVVRKSQSTKSSSFLTAESNICLTRLKKLAIEANYCFLYCAALDPVYRNSVG